MMLGARTAAWAKSGGGVSTAKDYVQDGLIAMWDGIENAGWGVHDPNATTWKDLTGNGNDLIVTKPGLWSDNAFNFDGTKCCYREDNLDGSIYFESCVFLRTGRWIINLSNKPSYTRFMVLSKNRQNIMGKSPTSYIFTADVGSRVATVGFDYSSVLDCYQNGVKIDGLIYSDEWNNGVGVSVGYRPAGSYTGAGIMHRLCVYNRALTNAEIAANFSVDKARFNLP